MGVASVRLHAALRDSRGRARDLPTADSTQTDIDAGAVCADLMLLRSAALYRSRTSSG